MLCKAELQYPGSLSWNDLSSPRTSPHGSLRRRRSIQITRLRMVNKHRPFLWVTVFAVTLCFCGVFPTSGTAETCNLYVSPNGSDSNPGTLSQPWKTAQHAFSSVHAGQTVCFRHGT